MDASTHSRSLLDSNSDDEYNNGDETSVNVIGTPVSTSGQYSDHEGIDNDGMNTTTNDELEDDEEVLIKRPHTVPHDRLSFTYVAFYLLGMTTLLPWNFFMTAEPVSDIFIKRQNKMKNRNKVRKKKTGPSAEICDCRSNVLTNNTCRRIYQF